MIMLVVFGNEIAIRELVNAIVVPINNNPINIIIIIECSILPDLFGYIPIFQQLPIDVILLYLNREFCANSSLEREIYTREPLLLTNFQYLDL